MITPGTLCFAKVRGYFPWPARVDVLPKDVKLPRGKIPVFFYGTHQVSLVSENDIFDFEKYKEDFCSKKGKNVKFSQGVVELERNPKILQLGYDEQAIIFLSQYYEFDHNNALADYDTVVEDQSEVRSGCSSINDSRKRHLSDSSEVERQKITAARLANSIKSDLFIELHKIDTDNKTVEEIIREEEKKDLYNVPSKICHIEKIENSIHNEVSFKNSIERVEIIRPKRASAVRFKENLESYKREWAASSYQSEVVGKIKIFKKAGEENTQRHLSAHHTKRHKVDNSQVSRSPPVCQHPVPQPMITEEDRHLRIVSQLSVIDKEIKRTLVVGNENYDLCKTLLQKLGDIDNVNLICLCKVPEIVITLRKCRRYKKNDSIREYASVIYQRFFQIYDRADIDEKIDAGAELLKRDSSKCKSAQTLMDELFVADVKCPSSGFVTQTLSSPGSVISQQSSSTNTAILSGDIELGIVDNINELLANGTMELIESYEAQKHFIGEDFSKSEFEELYETLGV